MKDLIKELNDLRKLSKEEREKLKKLSKISKDIEMGINVNIKMNIQVKFIWREGTRGYVSEPDLYNSFEPIRKEAEKKINKEIEGIIKFSNSCADKIGIDRNEFWRDYFLNLLV